MEETLLPFEQGGALVGQLLERLQSLLAPAGMPNHGEEHGRHERHLEELACELRSAVDVEKDQRACGDEYDGESP